jgi:hypothetical protein
MPVRFANNKKKNSKGTVTREKEEKIKKLHKHINYCVNLENAYKQKHEEVRRLTEYLQKLVTQTPNKPISETNIVKIMDGIGDIKIPDNTENRQQKLTELIKVQREWKGEVNVIKPQIENKLRDLMNPITKEETVHKKFRGGTKTKKKLYN